MQDLNNSSSNPESIRGSWIMSGIAIAVAGVLAFTGITANKFWDDEANTAIFAQNLLDTGQLSAWNGTNLIGYRDGAELDENLEMVLNFDMAHTDLEAMSVAMV